MATLGTLITAVTKKLLDTSNTIVSTADVADNINAAINYYKFYRFWFNESEATITLTEGSGDITLPSGFLIDITNDESFTIVYNSVRYPLVKLDSAMFNIENTAGEGMPYCYTFRNNSYECYYLPDQNYTAECRYLKDYDAFQTDGTENALSNDFTAYAERLIMYNALSRLHGELRQDEKMEDYYSARADDELKNLQRRTQMQVASGRLTVESII